jgi:hypothetical protein
MWKKALAARAADYATAVLTTVDAEGYPVSVRCAPQLDAAAETIRLGPVAPALAGLSGKACLLFHRHDERLEGLRQLLIKGELLEQDGVAVLRPGEFVTANGRPDTDVMPHAGRPLHMAQFFLLGRRKAREYLAKRGAPWPPIPYDEFLPALRARAAADAEGAGDGDIPVQS